MHPNPRDYPSHRIDDERGQRRRGACRANRAGFRHGFELTCRGCGNYFAGALVQATIALAEKSFRN